MIQWLFLLFLVAFPKGGFKVASVPITWGYLFLFLLLLTYPFTVREIEKDRLRAFLMVIPFQIVVVLTLLISGFTESGFTLSLIVSFFILPIIAYFFPHQIELKKLRPIIFFVAAYGIFLFIFKLVTGKFLEIPFLTMNYHDLGTLGDKHNDRGLVFKLISTYNNGNLYGICILMLLPLFEALESRATRRFIVKLSLILTFSRTVWVGLLFYEMLFARHRILKIALSLIVLALLLVKFPFEASFFTDLSLGGRIEPELFYPVLFPLKPFENIGEMIYPHVMQSFGIFGLLTFLFAMLAPLLLKQENATLEQKAMRRGLWVYLFVAISDGALLYIPTMCFYWLLSSLSLGSMTTKPSKVLQEKPFPSS